MAQAGQVTGGAGPAVAARDARLYARSALALFLFLLWYAVWTLEANALALTGGRYSLLLWAPLPPTILVALAFMRRRAIMAAYAIGAYPPPPAVAPVALGRWDWLSLAAAALVAGVAADIGNRTTLAVPYIAASAIAAIAVHRIARRGSLFGPVPRAIGWRLPAFAVVVFAIYYLAHRFDADDANFVNLAVGAQSTHGGILQFDTMLGDGPNPIHLPTYRFHSFELLAAVLSTYTGLEPVAILHLGLPAPLLLLAALAAMLVLLPVAGRHWFAAALGMLAFLFLDEPSLASWGVHGIIRFQQGKGFLVTVLLPLIAALAWRWMTLGRRIDLFVLLLANVCAIGFSANGLYGGPAAMGFVAAAAVLADVRSGLRWRRAVLLALPCAYSVMAAALIVRFHLALPSEQPPATDAIGQLNLVVWYGLLGRAILVALAFVGLGLLQHGRSRAALVYFPLAMLLALNPLGFAAIDALTGHLGFRIFWSLPVAGLAGLLLVALLRLIGLRRERWIDLAAAAALALSAIIPTRGLNPATAIAWHRPGLKLDEADDAVARRLARAVPPRCRILAPERWSQLIAMIPGAAHPVFVRRLYLIHYRFTLPRAEIALRDRLRRVAEGETSVEPPSPDAIAGYHIPVGLIAVPRDARYPGPAATLAARLGLAGPVVDGPLLVWRGACRG